MKRKVVFFAAIVVILGFSSSAHAEAVCDEQLVVFGDSLSDTGNVLIASHGAFPPSPPYSGGRFTDGIGISAGLVWVESLADRLGLSRPTARLSNVYPATNYAFGGAVTGDSPAVYDPVLNPMPGTSVQAGVPRSEPRSTCSSKTWRHTSAL